MTCHVCRKELAKYKCPGCDWQTCSFECSKRHKEGKLCSGLRNPVAYVRRKDFSSSVLDNDYNFLVRVERDLDNAAKSNKRDSNLAGHNAVRPFVKRAKDVGEVTVLSAPKGLKRAKSNKSNWVGKKQCLSWTVEWIFEDEFRAISDRILDASTLEEAVRPHFEAIQKSKPEYKGKEIVDLNFLMKSEGTAANRTVYAKIEPLLSLSENLRHRTVVEFPTIHIYINIPSSVRLEQEPWTAPPYEAVHTGDMAATKVTMVTQSNMNITPRFIEKTSSTALPVLDLSDIPY